MLIPQQKQRQQLRILATATAKVTIAVFKCLVYKVNAITTTATSAAVSINNSINAKTITTAITV
jgi:hypothetical protein